MSFKFRDQSAYEVTEWSWDFGDGRTSATQSPMHRFPKSGVYEVCLIAKNKNGADTLCKTLTIGTTSVDNYYSNIKIEILPKPCEDYFIINVLDYIPEKTHMDLYEMQGRLVRTQRLFEGSNGVDVRTLSKGFCLLNIYERGVMMKVERVLRM